MAFMLLGESKAFCQPCDYIFGLGSVKSEKRVFGCSLKIHVSNCTAPLKRRRARPPKLLKNTGVTLHIFASVRA